MLEVIFPNSTSKTASMVLLIAVYLLLNTSLNLLNKWTLGHYGMAFPLTLTSAHMSFSFLVLAPFALRVPMETHVRTWEKQWKGLVCIGSFLALNIALNNISLIDISLSLNQVIRSSIPVVTCLLAIVVEGKVPGEREGWSLVMLTVGVMIAVWQVRFVISSWFHSDRILRASPCAGRVTWFHSCHYRRCIVYCAGDGGRQAACNHILRSGDDLQCCYDDILRQAAEREAGCGPADVLYRAGAVWDVLNP